MHKQTLEQLRNKFNACLPIAYFPNVFKEAKVKFIPEKDKSSFNPKDCRPISLLEVPGKIFGRLIQARLNTFLSENNIFKERKHGFKTYKGTHIVITPTYETITNALADKKQVYLDLRDVASLV